MQEAAEWGLVKWALEHIAIPLLGGMWGALAWWVNLIASRFQKMEERHAADTMALNAKLSSMDEKHADTYARREDLKDGLAHLREDMHTGFANVEKKLDMLVERAIKGSQG